MGQARKRVMARDCHRGENNECLDTIFTSMKYMTVLGKHQVQQLTKIV